MFKDRLKTFLGTTATAAAPMAGFPRMAAKMGGRNVEPVPSTRQSHGMEQFFSSIRDQGSLSILDFAGANQANISFITSLGHRLVSEDYVRSLELAFGDEDFYRNQQEPELAHRFLADSLSFPGNSFDGVLVWDALQFLSPYMLDLTIDRLHDQLRPGAYMLVFFYANEKTEQVPIYTYRISDPKTLLLTPRGSRERAQFFNNRALERIFQRFQSVKFFLTRDNLREILVRR